MTTNEQPRSVYATPEELRRWFSEVEYRHPNVAMALFLHPYEGFGNVCLAISFVVPDAYKKGEVQKQNVNVPIPPITSKHHFYDWLKWRLETIALHELNELFWVEGEIQLDPHSGKYWEIGYYL
jgi:hypothetical protein